MFKALFHKIGTAVANYLMQEVESSPALTLNDFAALEQVLRPGDVILIEGGSRISGPRAVQRSFLGLLANVNEAF